MKDLNFYLAPTVVGFGGNILKERVISIMKFKKPTALTTALSAFMVIGIGSTAAFAVAPMTEESETVSDPPPAVVTESDPVIEDNPADESFETGEAEPAGLKDETASENRIDNDEWSEPDENGFSYNKSGDKIRVPVTVITQDMIKDGFCEDGKCFSYQITFNEQNQKLILSLRLDNLPDGYNHIKYVGERYAIIEKCDCDSSESKNYTYEIIYDDGIIRG